MKVAFVTRKYVYGGNLSVIVNEIRKQGVEVEVISSKTNLGVNLVGMKTWFKDCDLIHVNGCWMGAFVDSRKPVVVTVHTTARGESKYNPSWMYKAGFWFENRTLRKADHIIAVSKSIQNELIEYPNVTAIPHSLPSFPNPSLHFERGINPRLTVLYSGRLERRKSVISIFESLPYLLRPIHLKLLGDGEQRKNLEYCQNWFKGKHKISFLGYIPNSCSDYWKHFETADIFVCPSLYEGDPQTVLEAMSYGLPILASDIPSHKEMLNNAGMFFHIYDIFDLQSKLNSLIVSSGVRQVFGSRAFERAKKRPGARDIAKQIIDVYEGMSQ